MIKNVRGDFPILEKTDIVYLDSAATALKPKTVINAVSDYYTNYPANVFRGLYPISAKATHRYEMARKTIANLVNAKSAEEVIFVRGATEAVNLVAYSWGRLNIGIDDEIVTSVMEHHSNFIPWQELIKENGAVLKVLDIDKEGLLLSLSGVVTKKTKLVALTHVSNVLGTINPIKRIVDEVKRINPNCLVLVDGAQAVPHMSVDVQDLGIDMYVFSGHKMMGPTGIGVLWVAKDLLEKLPPFQFGGSMIEEVNLERSIYAQAPAKFEAGTPHIAGAIGMAVATKYMMDYGVENIRKHEKELTTFMIKKLNSVNNLVIYGSKDVEKRAGVIAFNLFNDKGKLLHPHDVGDILGRDNICVRVGHHCAMPLAKRLGISASVRVALHIYNNKQDIDKLINSLNKAIKIFN